MLINLNKEEYEKCEQSSKNQWCSSKIGIYGKGILNNDNDQYKVERIGKLGEAALGKMISEDPNYDYKENGDLFDFNINGYAIDIKTSSYEKDYGLILAVNEQKKELPLKCDYYVMATLKEEDRSTKTAIIEIHGYCSKEDVLKRNKIYFPYRHSGLNYKISHNTLLPIENLIEIIKGEKI